MAAVLISHSKVSDAAVVGYYEASQATELPVAFIVAAPGVDKNEETKQEIREWFDGKVAYYKKLKGGIEWIDEVPKSSVAFHPYLVVGACWALADAELCLTTLTSYSFKQGGWKGSS